MWNDLKNPDLVAKKISNTLKRKGIKPPSRLGHTLSKKTIAKILDTKRNNGTIKHKFETILKIQAARKLYYDRIGRKSKFVERIKRTNKYKNWRKKIFERDGYKCVLCGHGGYVEADHILKKSKMFNACEYNFEKCMTYTPLWDISNGRTLCRPCHRLTPNFGNK